MSFWGSLLDKQLRLQSGFHPWSFLLVLRVLILVCLPGSCFLYLFMTGMSWTSMSLVHQSDLPLLMEHVNIENCFKEMSKDWGGAGKVVARVFQRPRWGKHDGFRHGQCLSAD